MGSAPECLSDLTAQGETARRPPGYDSFRDRVKQVRKSDELYFASLLSSPTIDSTFGDASGILDGDRVEVAEAAIHGGVQPWQISFQGTLATVTEVLPILGSISDPDELCDVLLNCCLSHVVGDRPDRYVPRVVKRRPKPFKLMQKPRREYNSSKA